MAGNPLASLFVSLGLDADAFNKGIDGATAKAQGLGKTGVSTGQVFSAGMVAAGAGLAVVTKGAMEAERAQGEFMAATGKSREEAEQFVSGMDSLAGSAGSVNRSFADIAAAGTMVEQQFQTTGQQTTDLTENILEFSKVTKQDATGAAADLEDTLSAFGLSADDASGFMDKLVASSQKWGTDVGPAQLSTLRAMSPALQTMGADIDDGIGLLNLFEDAGIDASAASRGLNSAITALPPGTTLDEFVQHLSDLKEQGIDPTTEAIKVFGNKAGAALALAIQPGMDGLQDLGVSAEDAEGHVKDAGEAMMTTSDKIKGFAQKLMAGAREIGQGFGPALTGAASAATLAAPLIKKMAPLGKLIAGPFAKSLSSGISGAFSGIGALLLKNRAVTGAMDGLGSLMGSRIGTALKAGAALALVGLAAEMLPGLMAEWDKIRVNLEGIQTQTTAATGKSTDEIIAAVANLQKVPETLDPVQRAIFEASAALPFALGDAKNTWGRSLGELTAELQARGIDVSQAVADYNAAAATGIADGETAITGAIDDSSTAAADALDAGAQAVADGFDKYVQTFEDRSATVAVEGAVLAIKDAETGLWDIGPDIAAAGTDTAEAVADWISKQNAAVQTGAGQIGQTLDDLKAKITSKLSAVQDAFNLGVDTKKRKNISGAKRLQQMADDIDTITKRMNESIKANDPVNTAYWEGALIDATNKYNTAKNNIGVDSATIQSEVAQATSAAGQDLTALGTTSQTAATTINNAAQQVNLNPAANNVDAAADDMRESFRLANQAAGLVPQGVQNNVGPTGTAASNMASAIQNNLTGLNTYLWGNHLGSDFVDGLDSNTTGANSLSSVVNHWTSFLDRKLGFSEPPPEGPLHNVPHWGPHMIAAWLGPMQRSGLPKVRAFANKLADAMALDPKKHRSADWFDTARPTRHDVPGLPGGHRDRDRFDRSNDNAADDGSGVTINVTVNGNVYGTGGVKALASDLERYYRRSTRGNKRLVGAF